MKTRTFLAGTACPKRMAASFTACVRSLLLLLLCALPPVAQAWFGYTIEGGAVTITGYTGPGGAVAIPATIGGGPVTSIGSAAFSGCTDLRRMFFEGNQPVTISAGAFEGSPTTLYYRPGASGWAATVDGCPTALWIPLTLGEAPPTTIGRLSLLTSSPPPATVAVQRSTNLRDWEDWQTISRDAGPSELRDPDASTVPCRFYRVVEE